MTATTDSPLDSVLQSKMSSAFMDMQNPAFPGGYPHFRSAYPASFPGQGEGIPPLGSVTSRGMASLGYPFPPNGAVGPITGSGGPQDYTGPNGHINYGGFSNPGVDSGKLEDVGK